MRRLIISSLILAYFTYFSPVSAQTAPQINGPTGGSFTVIDRRAEDEISEVSRLYINGALVSTFALSINHDSKAITVPVPLGRLDVPYVLCGEITVNHNGHIESHRVSSEGVLHNPDSHYYEAVGTENFNDFYLTDYADPGAAEHQPGHSAKCAAPTS